MFELFFIQQNVVVVPNIQLDGKRGKKKNKKDEKNCKFIFGPNALKRFSI